MALNDTPTCELLQKQIVHLEITDFQECASIPLGVIAQKFNRLRDLSLFLESPTVLVDSFILQVLSLWRDKYVRGYYIKGSLIDEISKNLRQWLIDHNHLRQEDSFIAEYDKNWTDIWLE
ncbi:unnamed protein product [Rotaria sordida]|uniref:Uncharacterized protein n=1 Tax=Rotaria sordida TaxID=392033 RepID=A0A813S7X9_9BILA|nr:unnamed protein product [Rotaria sordida]CAF0824160.1 unnamed protein product [Rotaria sordida]CAF0877907.1 unnamed protein product [Rotaria sordida]CAF3656290.1 unnamed protein product [Rotaria sordida]CAF3839082.1 unnamed protein product [Rotaria sordida]